MMRAILHGFHEPWHEPVLEKLVAELGIEYCQLSFSEFRPRMPQAISHFWWDLNWGEYHADWNRLRPLDEELLSRLSGAEAVFLKMCDRLEQAFPQSYQQRKNLYLKHVRYWNHVLLEEKIDFYLGLNVPHETWDFVVYSLCKLHGIPAIFGFQTQVTDTFVMLTDWERSLPDIERRYTAIQGEVDLSGRFLRDYQRQTQTAKPTPFYMNSQPAPSGPSLVSRVTQVARVLGDDPSLVRNKLLNPSFWVDYSSRAVETRRRARLDQEMLDRYERAASPPDLGKKFIYLPLHYQPEMTTSPLAGAFVDQVLIAQLLAATMPQDVHLYIKEHPMQKKLLGRHPEYYDELRALPRTTLVPKGFDTYELMQKSAAVATATGTAGWEALFREKPVLLFGHNFYQYAAGVFQVHSTGDCRRAMQRIFAEGFRPTLAELRRFLKALETTTSEGYLTREYGKVTSLTPEQNQANVLAALVASVRGR
jgi:hypothetical protein